MISRKLLLVVAMLCTFLLPTYAQSPPVQYDQVTSNELARIYAPIKTETDLYNHVTFAEKSPLNALSPSGKQLFLSSLTFGKNGLTSFQYDILERELTPTEIFGVLRLFGLQGDTYKLHNARTESSLDIAILNRGAEPVSIVTPNNDSITTMSGGDATYGDNFLMDYYCSAPGTCSKRTTTACTSSC